MAYRSSSQYHKSRSYTVRALVLPALDKEFHDTWLLTRYHLLRRGKEQIAYCNTLTKDSVSLRNQGCDEASKKSWKWQQDEFSNFDVDWQFCDSMVPDRIPAVRFANKYDGSNPMYEIEE